MASQSSPAPSGKDILVLASRAREAQLVRQAILNSNRNAGDLTNDNLATLKEGGRIYIVGHNTEFGDFSGVLNILKNQDQAVVTFDVVLFVCFAGAQQEGELASPAESVANFLQRPVQASRVLVTGSAIAGTVRIPSANFETFQPNTDILSRFANISISSEGSRDIPAGTDIPNPFSPSADSRGRSGGGSTDHSGGDRDSDEKKDDDKMTDEAPR